MRLAAYARVSTDRQAEQGVSIDDQISQIRQWAKENRHTIVDEFIEMGASAYGETRPIFQQMIDLALSEEHPYDAIAVHSQSRLYRDNMKRALLKRMLDKVDVKMILLTQPLPDDESSAYLLENVIGLIDEFQSRENSKHVVRCQRRKRWPRLLGQNISCFK